MVLTLDSMHPVVRQSGQFIQRKPKNIYEIWHIFGWTLEVGNQMNTQNNNSVSFHEFINIKFLPTNFFGTESIFLG